MPSPPHLERLVCLYVPGLDIRRIGPECLPGFDALRRRHGALALDTLPLTEHLPTILTGRLPHEHGLWGPRLRPGAFDAPRGALDRVLDAVPDGVAVAAQCAAHVLNGPLDGATIAPRRRRRLEWQRFKYMKPGYQQRAQRPLGGCPTMLSVLGDAARYRYHDDFDGLDRLAARIAAGASRLEVVEVHCLDRVQHWWLDRPTAMAGFHRRIDAFMTRIAETLAARGVGLLILSDHGMEPVERFVDVRALLDGLGLAPADHERFIETSKATLWARDAATTARLEVALRASPDGELLTRADLAARFGVAFADDAYGSLFFYAPPGASFYPNDFHHPLVGPAQALLDRQQRPRLRDPRHRGEHGYVPGCPAEEGVAVLVAGGREPARPRGRLVDVAPSVLTLLGAPVPPAMRGDRTLFGG